MASSTSQAIDELINEMSSASAPVPPTQPSQPRAENAPNWIVHSTIDLPVSHQLSPLIDAIRRIADVQDGLAATLDAQGVQMKMIGETQDKILKDLAEVRDGTCALDAQTHLESEGTAAKHPDSTVRILSAWVRGLQTNQIQIQKDLANMQGKLTLNGTGKQKEKEKPEKLEKMDSDVPTGPSKLRSMALTLRPHTRENLRPSEQIRRREASPNLMSTSKALAKIGNDRGDNEIPDSIKQALTNINTRCQSLELLRKRDADHAKKDAEDTLKEIHKLKHFIQLIDPRVTSKEVDKITDASEDMARVKGHLYAAIGQREHSNVVNHLRSTVKIEVLEQQMAMVLQVLADSTELPREVVHRFRKCTIACQDMEDRMAYWRQRLQMATTISDPRLVNSLNTAVGELKMARAGSPGPPKQPNAEGMKVLIGVGEWMLRSYAGILMARKDYRYDAFPEPPALFENRKRAAGEDDEYYGRLKRRPDDEPPRGRTLFPEAGRGRVEVKETVRGFAQGFTDFYPPRSSRTRPSGGNRNEARSIFGGRIKREGADHVKGFPRD